jgi:soluble lytic murein transglycosylase
VAQAQSKSDTRGDDVIVEMSQAFKKNDSRRLTALLPRARGHMLEAWAAYFELRARLDTATAQEVQDFLARYAGSYQEDRLRNDWLQLLGQRRDWTTFSAEYPRFRMRDDREVRCYLALIETIKTEADIADEVRRNWYSQRDTDEGCTLAADHLLAGKKFADLDIWRKARLSVEANRAKAARSAVEIVAPQMLSLVTELMNNPARFLSARATAPNKVRRELVVLGLIRMATNDPDAAAGVLENKWGPQLTAEERNWAWGAIGKQSAMKLSNDALDYFGKVTKDSDLTDDMLGWMVRAALRAGREPRWPVVLGTIKAMTDEGRKDPAWVYWKARALRAQAAAIPVETHATRTALSEANALLESIASQRGFYEQLAMEELGRKIALPPRTAPLTAQEKEAARLNPTLNRGLYAIMIGLRQEGVREWNYGTNVVNSAGQPGGMSERELLAAAAFACEREVWDRCINTSDRTKVEMDVDQRFPMPFRESVIKRAGEIGLDPSYVYGLIRQESRFIMDARSGVGASGLMQVMPATARWTAKKIGLTGFTTDQLNDRDTNIAIGTAYLKLVLDDFDGSMALAAAAYNAGPSRSRNWRNGPVLEGAIWAENVPFSETRDYVKKVLSNATIYAAVLSGQPQSLKARLATVGPRDPREPEPVKDLP